MKLPIYQIDAFAEKQFQGNPAAVCPLEYWLPDEILQSIAEENNLSETSFYIEEEGFYGLRWFTPTHEVDLCGHATLAAAHVIFEKGDENRNKIIFQSKSGILSVTKSGDLLELDFPSRVGVPCEAPAELIQGLGKVPVQCFKSVDYMIVYEDEETIASLCPDFSKLREINTRGVIVTAPGKTTDFVSRFFAPSLGVNEDPVTGSAHCTMTPFWSEKLGKKSMVAKQLSKRTGYLQCTLKDDRVLISGRTVAYLEGFIHVQDIDARNL